MIVVGSRRNLGRYNLVDFICFLFFKILDIYIVLFSLFILGNELSV